MQNSAKCRRRVAVISGLVALVTCSLLACAPDPDPTPSPTPAFASEEAAFAAAEEVYRAYNDADNRTRSGVSGAEPEDFLVGGALDSYLEGQEILRSNHLSLDGTITVESFVEWSVNLDDVAPEVTTVVCLDISKTRTIDTTTGADVTPPRPTLIAQQVTFAYDGSNYAISDELEGEESSCTSD